MPSHSVFLLCNRTPSRPLLSGLICERKCVDRNTITRDATAWANGGVAVASENEWYKAAYYQPFADGGDTDSYWLYSTASNAAPTSAEANYNANDGNEPDDLADVGYSVASYSRTKLDLLRCANVKVEQLRWLARISKGDLGSRC